MRKLIVTISALMCLSLNAFNQDLIRLKGGASINCKVTSVDSAGISYYYAAGGEVKNGRVAHGNVVSCKINEPSAATHEAQTATHVNNDVAPVEPAHNQATNDVAPIESSSETQANNRVAPIQYPSNQANQANQESYSLSGNDALNIQKAGVELVKTSKHFYTGFTLYAIGYGAVLFGSVISLAAIAPGSLVVVGGIVCIIVGTVYVIESVSHNGKAGRLLSGLKLIKN